jgi:general secretion pathway protein D
LTAVAQAFGVTASFDDSVVARPVHFDITNVDFYTAISAACQVTHTFWTPLQEKQILLAEESPENHRKFDRMAMRTFFLPGMTAPADMNNLVTVLRNLFDIKIVAAQPASGTITLRAPDDLLDSATQFIESLDSSRPEVMLDVRVYEISYMLTRNFGLQIPDNFQLFNIPAAALVALAGQNVQSLINQLISSGGINQANSTAISALLAQLEGQGQQNSIFSQPVATFGNGQTLEGVSLGTLGVQASETQSWVKTLEHSTLRVSQGSDASFRVGSRYPILNASFAPIYNSPAIAQVIGNNSFQAPFPSFSYEDLGLNLKTKTLVNGDSAISLQLDLQLRTLLGQSMNGIRVISNREFQGSLTLEDGQPAVVAGEIDHTEQRSINGVPGLGAIPGLSQILDSNNIEDTSDELLIVITPRIIGEAEHKQAVVWITH